MQNKPIWLKYNSKHTNNKYEKATMRNICKSQQPVKAGAEGIPEIHHKLLIDVTKWTTHAECQIVERNLSEMAFTSKIILIVQLSCWPTVNRKEAF